MVSDNAHKKISLRHFAIKFDLGGLQKIKYAGKLVVVNLACLDLDTVQTKKCAAAHISN
jgi:hypothetical protein